MGAVGPLTHWPLVCQWLSDLKIEGSIPSPCFQFPSNPSSIHSSLLPQACFPKREHRPRTLPGVRAPLLCLLLLLPLAAAGGEAGSADLIVTLREPGPTPEGALPLALFPGFIVPDASAADAARLLRDPRVLRVDWAKPLEWHASPALPAAAHHGLTRVDPEGPTGRGVTVAVLDSGIDAGHPDLAGRVAANVRLVQGRFVEAPGDADGHGTHVAGIVAASGASSGGRWAGVAPDARLVGLDISGRFTTASAILAYEWLAANREAHDIRLVVNAWGRIPDGEPYDPADPELRAIDRLVASGVVVLFSASNRGPGRSTLSIEAMHPNVITVGATDAAGMPMAYSSRGPVPAQSPWTKPDVMAPGDAVVGPRASQAIPRGGDPDALHTVYSGTSQAVPHVAGIVARMLEAAPTLTPREVADALRASAIDLGEPGPDDATGHGLVDARDALLIALGHAPERGNVLIAGGADLYTDALDAPGTPRRGILDILERPQLVWETPFPVKPGAERLRASASATGAQGLAIELAKDGQVVRGSEVDDPQAGIWTLRLRGTLPVAAEVRMLIETQLPPQPERALAFDTRASRGAPADAAASAVEGVALTLAGCAAAGALVGAALMPRRRGGE
jgi:hypothetical protein